MRVLMVCLGNICRSPLAQGILESKANASRLPLTVDSAGTSAWHVGEAPDKRSINIASEHGIDISQQRARQFVSNDYFQFDLILAMDSANYRDILALAPNDEMKQKVKLIMNYVWPGQNRAVPDPYWDGNFENVFQLLDQACDQLLKTEISNK